MTVEHGHIKKMRGTADLFCEEVSSNGGLVLVGELLVHVLIHQGGLPHPTVAKDDHLHITGNESYAISAVFWKRNRRDRNFLL
jgi:hypothetical protein